MKRNNERKIPMGRSSVAIPIVLGFLITASVFAAGTPESERFDYRNVREIEINAGIFDIEVTEEAVPGALIEIFDIPQGFRVSERERNGSVVIDIQGRNTWFSRFSGDPRIRVTNSSTIDLDLQTATGDIVVETVRGSLVLRTASGDIALGNIGGDAAIHTASGDVVIEEGVGVVSINTASGDVGIDSYRGSFQIDTASGEIRIDELRLASDATIRTASGDVSVRLENDPRDVGYDLASHSGDLRFGNVRGSGSLKRDGGRFVIEARSASGDISIW